MSRRYNKTGVSPKAQEMLMQDILEGMEHFVTLFGYRAIPCEYEIIAVEQNAVSHPAQNAPGAETHRSADVISYIERKQQLALKLSA